MEYISAEEFLKQPEKIQKVFVDWWQCEIGDLFSFDGDDDRDLNILQVVGSENQIIMTKANKGKSRIPLLTEGQLREFIEEKTNGKIRIIEFDFDHYNIITWKRNFITEENKLLQAYWKLALEIAKGCKQWV